MAEPNLKRMTIDEYLEFEEHADVKHEFIDGEMFLMAGGSINHNQIAVNTIINLGNKLKDKPCRVLNSDMRLHIDMFDLFTYPDVMVICGKPELYADRNDTVTNPVLIVEVLSPSTRNYDRSSKFTYYRSIPTLKEYVMIDQNKYHVEYYRKLKTGEWLLSDHDSIESAFTLQSLEIELSLKDLYQQVEWEK